jgi:hypothetical protein
MRLFSFYLQASDVGEANRFIPVTVHARTETSHKVHTHAEAYVMHAHTHTHTYYRRGMRSRQRCSGGAGGTLRYSVPKTSVHWLNAQTTRG